MRLLVDTNVFLDLMLRREPGCKDAINFFVWSRQHRNQTYITSMSLRDVEYIAARTFHDHKKANVVLARTYALCSKVIGVSADSAITAIYEDYKDYKDELMIQAAKEESLDAIITNNVSDFVNRGIPVFTPDEIIKKVVFADI